MEHRQLIIIGAGPAGLSSAIYARRAGLDTLVLEPGLVGGMINSTAEIENYPGLRRVGGMELAGALRSHTEMFAPEFRECRVVSLDTGGETRDKIVVTDKGSISASAVVIATGTSFARVGCKGEEHFTGHGVSYCAVCDGPFYEGAEVAVIGGGNAAVEEAEFLTKFASKVYVIHRRDEFRADRSVIGRALDNPRIEPLLSSVVDEIAGENMVERISVRNVKTGETRDISVEGVFVFVGMKPEIGFLDGLDSIKRTEAGWIVTDDKMETSCEGIFAAGDVRLKFLRQAVTAAGDGAVAAMAAYEYITNMEYLDRVLFEGPRSYALLISGEDQNQAALARSAESLEKSSGIKLMIADVYRTARVRARLGVDKLPAVAEIANGKAFRISGVSSVEDIKNFIGEAVK
ncbi:MAG: FAD-dependent oxidoreductase [Synergistaceae bacterium]|jgi:thioredoxin reductase (NADPH)|nr:FAD-dependent oxidoreductase [Synergistaceae bacterium]